MAMTANPLVRMVQIAFTLTALVALSFAWISVCEAGAGIPDDQGLAEVVVTTAFEGFQRSIEGTVVARFENLEKREPVRIWVREKGVLREGSRKDLDRAFGNDRKKWPPYTLLYTVTPGAAGRYEVEIRIYYDMGLIPESRGGYSERWKVARQKGRWVVLSKETTMNWD
jgi:hypothetical protein